MVKSFAHSHPLLPPDPFTSHVSPALPDLFSVFRRAWLSAVLPKLQDSHDPRMPVTAKMPRQFNSTFLQRREKETCHSKCTHEGRRALTLETRGPGTFFKVPEANLHAGSSYGMLWEVTVSGTPAKH